MSDYYTRPSTPLDDHIAWREAEGHNFKVYESGAYVSVEATFPQEKFVDISIFRRSNGKKITDPMEYVKILHGLIKGKHLPAPEGS